MVNGLKNIFLLLYSLSLFEFSQFTLSFPFLSQHLFLLMGHVFLLIFFFLLPFLLNSKDGISFFDLLLLLLFFETFLLFFLEHVSAVELGEKNLF